MGNCGFGVAPTRPEHRDTIVRTLENVEGMSIEALDAGIDWCFESFPEYLAALDERAKRLNVGAFIGHTPLRLFVLGGDERAATADEVEAMRGDRARGDRGRRARVLHVAAARPPGRLRPPGAQPLRRDRRGVRAGVGARRAGQGHRPGVDRARDVRRPVLRDVGAPRRPRHLDRARRPGRQAGRRPAHGRAGRGAARRGLPADRLPPDRHADLHDRSRAAGRDRRVEGGARAAPRRARRPLRRPRPGATGPAPSPSTPGSHRWPKTSVEETGHAPRRGGCPARPARGRAGHHAVRRSCSTWR